MRLATAQMAEKLNHDPVLCDQLIPKWELGCRRVTPGPGYLESFMEPNCSLTSSPITRITEKGVVTADGEEFECDVGRLSCVVSCRTAEPRLIILGQSCVPQASTFRTSRNSP